MSELIEIYQECRSTINAKCKPDGPYFDPTFPKPRKIGKRNVAWSLLEVMQHRQNQPFARSSKENQ